jgi:hypothetical protein
MEEKQFASKSFRDNRIATTTLFIHCYSALYCYAFLEIIRQLFCKNKERRNKKTHALVTYPPPPPRKSNRYIFIIGEKYLEKG